MLIVVRNAIKHFSLMTTKQFKHFVNVASSLILAESYFVIWLQLAKFLYFVFISDFERNMDCQAVDLVHCWLFYSSDKFSLKNWHEPFLINKTRLAHFSLTQLKMKLSGSETSANLSICLKMTDCVILYALLLQS